MDQHRKGFVTEARNLCSTPGFQVKEIIDSKNLSSALHTHIHKYPPPLSK